MNQILNEPKISIILINWNQKLVTVECIESLKKVDYSNYEIILVDNGSKDDSIDFFKNKCPEIILIANEKNFGFAEANNIGIKKALENKTEFIFILNNDTVVDKNVLKELVSVFSKNKNIAAVTPKVYDYYKQDVIDSAGGISSLIKGKIYPIGYGELDIGQYDEEREINFISGCALFIKSNVFKELGFFDREFFAYCEDQDWCYKAIKKGYKLVYVPKARIWHKVSASTGGYKNPISIYLFTKNRIKFVKKHANILQKIIFYSYFTAYIPAFIIFHSLTNKSEAVKAFLRAILSLKLKSFRIKDFEYPSYLKNFIKIGINSRYLQRSITGIERYLLELLQNYDTTKINNEYVLFFSSHEPVTRITSGKNFSYNITKRSTRNRFLRILWEQLFLTDEITNNDVDVFHGPSFVLPIIKPCKYVLTIHDLAFLKYPESFTLENQLYFKLFLPWSIRRADAIIADSNSTKKDIIKHFNVEEKKIKVIYLGIDKHFKKVTDKKTLDDAKIKYNLPEKYILFTGVLSPRKNIERTIEAFAETKKTFPELKFVIVGKKGWLYKNIFLKIKELNLEKEVVFTDYVHEKDLPAIYSQAQLLVLASLYEGFGLPILEAMACECPVITSNTSSMPEVAGDSALLVNPFSVQEITEAILKILKDKKLTKELIEKGKGRIKLFEWRRTAEETLKVYKEV